MDNIPIFYNGGEDVYSAPAVHIRIGALIALTFLGTFQIILFCHCMSALLHREDRTKATHILLWLLSILCLLNTYWNVASIVLSYPLQAIGCSAATVYILQISAYCTPAVTNVVVDGLMVWRCYIILVAGWTDLSRYACYFICALLCSIFLASCVASAFFALLIAIAPPQTNFLIFPATSLSVNILVTTMIVIRLTLYRFRLRSTFGQDYGHHYRFAASVFIESAALYAIWMGALMFTGRHALTDPIDILRPSVVEFEILFLCSPTIQVISSHLILYRVANGQAFSSATLSKSASTMSSLAFAAGDEDVDSNNHYAL